MAKDEKKKENLFRRWQERKKERNGEHIIR